MKCTVLLVVLLFGAVLAKKVVNLPQYNGPTMSQYTGYISLDEGKQYFYWLVESLNKPTTDPLIVWFQGGPGCSGLLGLFTEHGPYRPDGNGGIEFSDLTWVNFANVLYIEQPAGVGYSYSNTQEGYTTNDTQAALDNFQFLENWIQAFPQYKGRQTWLAGESYAGVYIPTVTSVILDNPDSLIAQQLYGLTLGNPVISCESLDYNAVQMDLFYYHAYVSWLVYSNWTSHGCSIDSSLKGCDEIFNVAQSQIGVIFQEKRDGAQQNEPSLDPDDIYQDWCTGNATLDFILGYGYPEECVYIGEALTTYLNRADVQQAVGAKSTTWAECAGSPPFNYVSLGQSMIPHYQQIFANSSLQVLVYSGDVDIATVPFGFTKACLGELKQEPKEVWQPWFINGVTAGYVERFPDYTYATVKGAGHEAPQYQPVISYQLINRFITQGSINTEPARIPRKRITQGNILRERGIRG